MQMPSDRRAGASNFKRGVVQPWLPEANKLADDWQMGGHWQPANVRRELPKVWSGPRSAPRFVVEYLPRSRAHEHSEEPHITQPHSRSGAGGST
jgi:hypothetical protein